MSNHYADPYAARYERVNVSVDAYQAEAIRRTCKAFRKKKADLLYRWVFEPESNISQDSRRYFHSILETIESEHIRACA